MGGKTDSEVYKKISRFDPGIADRWWAVTAGNVKAPISAADLQKIIGDLDSKVTAQQAGAIDQLDRWHDNFTEEAHEALRVKLILAHNKGAIWRGASQRLNGPSSRALPERITDAFKHIANVNFTSPASNFQYSPSQYLAVLELIRKQEIYLYEVEDHGLTVRAGGPTAYYDRSSDPRMLVINQERYTGTFSQRTLIHECTHAIQDWAKVPGLVGKQAEADGLVCGWVVGRAMGETLLEGLAEEAHFAAYEAADFVIKKKTVSDRKNFVELYGRLVGFVESNPNYANEANKAFAYPDPENTDQKKMFSGLLAKQ
jgi:hypothetical protein